MSAKLRQALGSAVLAGLLLLPFAARLYKESPPPPPPPLPALTAPSEVAVLIRRHRYEEAHAALRRSGPPEAPALATVYQFRLAVCERALGLADSAHARLLRLEGRRPEIEAYRRLWLAHTLQLLNRREEAVAGYEALLVKGGNEAVADSARLYLARLFVAGGDHRRALALYRAQRAATGPT